MILLNDTIDVPMSLSDANHDSYLTRLQRLKDVFARLNIVEPVGNGIPYIDAMPSKYARWLVFSDTPCSPHYKESSQEETEKQLQELRDKIKVLVSCIDLLNKPAYEAISDIYRTGLPHFRLQALALHMAASECHPVSNKTRGRPAKHAAKSLVKELADDYFRLTGKEATLITDPYLDGKPTGDFFHLVEKVFEVLEIKDSPESSVRSILYGNK